MKKPILIIEDNEQTLYLITFILKKHGYDVVQARDGREGIELAGRVEPALILLDIQLPVLDGYAVARELRSNAALGRCPDHRSNFLRHGRRPGADSGGWLHRATSKSPSTRTRSWPKSSSIWWPGHLRKEVGHDKNPDR